MEFNEKEVKRLIVIVLIIILAVLVFFLLKPVLLSIIGGLILAYIFFPLHRKIRNRLKWPDLAASITTLIVIAIVVIPLWLFFPIMIKQGLVAFKAAQDLNIQVLVTKLFPTASQAFTAQIVGLFNTFVSKVSSTFLSSLVSWILNIPKILFQLSIVFFVFYFTLRDWTKLKKFMSDISPLSKLQDRTLVSKFREVTDAILYGQIIIGLIQGIVAGIGLLIFGVPNTLLLAVLSVLLGIIPILGPPVVWVPVTFYLLITANPLIAILFFIYNILLTSGVVEHILKPYIMARRTDLSTVIVLIGMIGGLFFFGFLGIFLGPLLLAYFTIVLRAYREKSLGSLFSN